MKYFIITGASKGLGEGIALELIDENHHLICISRSESQKVKQQTQENGCGYTFIAFDLGYSHEIPQLAARIFEQIPADTAQGVYLVNNAGVVEPVGRAELCNPEEVEHHLHLNLLTPMLLTSAFLQHTLKWPVQKRILNISSGAAVNAYWGWSSYCTGKAGLDMFTKCVALEQNDSEQPTELMAVAPGILDTDMQEVLRNTTEDQFIMRSRFVELKQNNLLIEPQVAGQKMAKLLLSDEFQNGKIIDLRNSY